MTAISDNELLHRLAKELDAIPAQPTPGEQYRFRAALAEHNQMRHVRRIRVPRLLPAVAGALFAFSGMVSGAAYAGVVLPSPFRTAAVAVGLPVDDAKVASARSQIGQLRKALSSGNRHLILITYQKLQVSIQDMSVDDRAEVSALAASALKRADQVLDEPADLDAAADSNPPGDYPGGSTRADPPRETPTESGTPDTAISQPQSAPTDPTTTSPLDSTTAVTTPESTATTTPGNTTATTTPDSTTTTTPSDTSTPTTLADNTAVDNTAPASTTNN